MHRKRMSAVIFLLRLASVNLVISSWQLEKGHLERKILSEFNVLFICEPMHRKFSLWQLAQKDFDLENSCGV